MLRRHSEGVGHPVEESEQGDDVHGLGDLIFAPACITQPLHVYRSGAVGRLGDEPGVLQQRPLSGGEP